MNKYFPNASSFASLIHFSCDKINIKSFANQGDTILWLLVRWYRSHSILWCSLFSDGD